MTDFDSSPNSEYFEYTYVRTDGVYKNIKDSRLNPIPSNTIIHKTITGIGITTAEILEETRDSILVLPNLPVIKGKQKKHEQEDNTFAVHEDIKVEELVNYLKRKDEKRKKILTTPESFLRKVKPAMKMLKVEMYQNYFLLFDEAHKFIIDNDYREAMILPFNEFFTFKQKAIVTATPLKFSDPRFREQSFVQATINPIYDLKQDLKLIYTNNHAYALKRHMQEYPCKHFCIFYNSLDGIKSMIKVLQLGGKAKVFCSSFSKKELTIAEYQNVYSEYIKENGLAQYNFFTSSFYNGVDIEVEGEKPQVIMMTSTGFADHTVIDPATGAIQIAGRFRNGISGLAHITNTDEKLSYLTPDQIVEQVNISSEVYQAIERLQFSAPSEYAHKLYTEALFRIHPYASLLEPIGLKSTHEKFNAIENSSSETKVTRALSHFKLDNYFYLNKVKAYYTAITLLIKAYEESRAFNLTKAIWYSPLDKNTRLRRLGGRYTSPKVYRDLCSILNQMDALYATEPHEYQREFNRLRQEYSLIVDAYVKLGPTVIHELKYKHRTIQQEIIKKDAQQLINSHPVMDAVYNSIATGYKIPRSKAKAKLQELYFEYNIKKVAKATDLTHFFEVDLNVKMKIEKKDGTIEWVRAVKPIRRLHNVHWNYKRS